MIVTCFGQEPESLRWWRLTRDSVEAIHALPLHRRFVPHANNDEATLIAEGARPEEGIWVDEARLPVEAREPHPLRCLASSPCQGEGWGEGGPPHLAHKAGNAPRCR